MLYNFFYKLNQDQNQNQDQNNKSDIITIKTLSPNPSTINKKSAVFGLLSSLSYDNNNYIRSIIKLLTEYHK
jgi:hypothetical protein